MAEKDDKKDKKYSKSSSKRATAAAQLEDMGLSRLEAAARAQKSLDAGMTFKETPNYAKENEGFLSFVGGIANMGADIGRNFHNLGDSTVRWLMSRPQAPVGGGRGDAMFGAAPYPERAKPEVVPPPISVNTQPKPDAAPFDPMAGYRDPFGPVRDYLTEQAPRDRAVLDAIYKAAQSDINAQDPRIRQIYADAATGYNQAQQGAANAVTAGYGASGANMARLFNALGIGEAANVISSRGESLEQAMNPQVSNLARMLQIDLSRNTGREAIAREELARAARGVGSEGARQQAAYERALAGRLADLEAQSVGARNQYQQASVDSERQAAQAAAELASEEALNQLRYGRPSAQDVSNNTAQLYAAGTQLGLSGTELSDYVQAQLKAIYG